MLTFSYLISLPRAEVFMEMKSVENGISAWGRLGEKLFLSSFYIKMIAYSFLRLCASKQQQRRKIFYNDNLVVMSSIDLLLLLHEYKL